MLNLKQRLKIKLGNVLVTDLNQSGEIIKINKDGTFHVNGNVKGEGKYIIKK